MTTPVNNGSTYLANAGEGTVPQWPGIYAGTVVNNNDPLGVGRLQLNVPQVLGNAVSAWAVPLGTYYSIPNNTTTVACSFIGGDPSQPTWIGPLDLDPIINSGITAVYYTPSAPADPKIGDIWYETFAVDGTTFYGPAQIWTFNSGTSTFSWVTSAQSGAGSNPLGVVEPGITGGTITGAEFIGDGTGNEMVLYDGPPAAGNLNLSVVSANATDTHSNDLLKGTTVYGSLAGPAAYYTALQMTTFESMIGESGPVGFGILPWSSTTGMKDWSSTIDPSTNGTVWGFQLGGIYFYVLAGSSQIYMSGNVAVTGELAAPTLALNNATVSSDATGDVTYVNAVDGNTYRTGRFTGFGNSGQTISSTSATAISGMTINVKAGSNYHVQGWVTYNSSFSAGTPTFGFGGTSTRGHADGRSAFLPSGGSFSDTTIYNGALGNATGPALTGASLTRWEYDIFIFVTGTGTFTTTALTSNATDTFVIDSGYVRAETF